MRHREGAVLPASRRTWATFRARNLPPHGHNTLRPGRAAAGGCGRTIGPQNRRRRRREIFAASLPHKLPAAAHIIHCSPARPWRASPSSQVRTAQARAARARRARPPRSPKCAAAPGCGGGPALVQRCCLPAGGAAWGGERRARGRLEAWRVPLYGHER